MSNTNTKKDLRLSLKVMVNKEKTKVIFAEADSDFVSVLLSFLLLPLGRIVKLLENHYADKAPVFGSITSLYKGFGNLDDAHFSTPAAKLMLLDPPSSSDSLFRKLKFGVFKDSPPEKYFVCRFRNSCKHKNVCMYYRGSADCGCGLPLDTEVKSVWEENTGVFTRETASFIISDDLTMVPNSAGFFQTLRKFGNLDGAEQRNFSLGTNEIMDLLKCCLLTNTPLTDFLLKKGEIISSSSAKPDPGIFLHQIKHDEPTDAHKIFLKLMIHKSSNKVLFAEAEDDFMELLCSFLIIPIAGVEPLLDTNTCLYNLDNLYRSISDETVDKYFISPQAKERLMNPKIPHSFASKNTFLPLKYERFPVLKYVCDSYKKFMFISHACYIDKFSHLLVTFKSPKGEGNHVKGGTTYLVTDDLTVSPFHISSALTILNNLNISLSDVVEREVNIGLQEGLSILKASLTSNSALTNGLMNRNMWKQPKHEH